MAREVAVSGADAKAAESTGVFQPYPAGNYVGTIIDVKQTKFARQGANADLDALNVTIRFTESNTGKGEGKKFIAWQVPDGPKFPGSGKSAFLFYQFYKALGVVFPAEGESGAVSLPDLEELLDQEIGVTLRIEDDQKGVARNRVGAFFPASKGVGEAAASAKDDAVSDDFTL